MRSRTLSLSLSLVHFVRAKVSLSMMGARRVDLSAAAAAAGPSAAAAALDREVATAAAATDGMTRVKFSRSLVTPTEDYFSFTRRRSAKYRW